MQAVRAARHEAKAGGAADDETGQAGARPPSDLMRQLAAAQASARVVGDGRGDAAECRRGGGDVCERDVRAEQQRGRDQSAAAAAAAAAAATRRLATEGNRRWPVRAAG